MKKHSRKEPAAVFWTAWLLVTAVVAVTSPQEVKAESIHFVAGGQTDGWAHSSIAEDVDRILVDYDEGATSASASISDAMSSGTSQAVGTASASGQFAPSGGLQLTAGTSGYAQYAASMSGMASASWSDEVYLPESRQLVFEYLVTGFASYDAAYSGSGYGATARVEINSLGDIHALYMPHPSGTPIIFGWTSFSIENDVFHGRITETVSVGPDGENLWVSLVARGSAHPMDGLDPNLYSYNSNFQLTLNSITGADGLSVTFASGMQPPTAEPIVPEPSTLALLLIGGACAVWGFRRDRRHLAIHQ